MVNALLLVSVNAETKNNVFNSTERNKTIEQITEISQFRRLLRGVEYEKQKIEMIVTIGKYGRMTDMIYFIISLQPQNIGKEQCGE